MVTASIKRTGKRIVYYTEHNSGKGRSLFTFVPYLSSVGPGCPTIHQNWSNYFTFLDRSNYDLSPSPHPRLLNPIHYILSLGIYLLTLKLCYLPPKLGHTCKPIHTTNTVCRLRIGNFVWNENVTHQNIDGGTPLALANLKAKYYINRATIKIFIWDIHNVFCLQSFCFWGFGTETKKK